GSFAAARRHERQRRHRHRAAPHVRVAVRGGHERRAGDAEDCRAARRGAQGRTSVIAAGAAPSANMRRVMVTVCAMSATIMQALDTTIANVALPYMQGSLSASLDQINWVLTSYIVASAIMTAPIGWVAERYGRKRLFIICAAGFTVASVLCGLAQSI